MSQCSFILWLFRGVFKIAGLICKGTGEISNLFQICDSNFCRVFNNNVHEPFCSFHSLLTRIVHYLSPFLEDLNSVKFHMNHLVLSMQSDDHFTPVTEINETPAPF